MLQCYLSEDSLQPSWLWPPEGSVSESFESASEPGADLHSSCEADHLATGAASDSSQNETCS